jgi:WD40 repeat protein
LRGHSGFVRRLAFTPDRRRLVSLGDDGQLKFWDLSTEQAAMTLQAHTRNGVDVAISPDGRRIATSGAEDSVKVWDATPESAARQ